MSKSNTARAVDELRELIFEGTLPAGSNHLETELAERLGMSRTPVREAALRLEGQGLVELIPRKGIRVLPVSAQDMAEIYDILTELESLAAHTAASRGLTAIDLDNLGQSIRDMDKALAREDRESWAEADDRFHTELVALSGNHRLRLIAAMMTDQVRRARAATLYLRPLPMQSNDAHRGVRDAIAQGDAAAARQLHHAHRKEAKAMLVALLDKHRLPML